MLKKSIVEELFKAFYIERWNDKIRPVELIEMDKHAHKMIIAYCLGKYEEDSGKKIEWENIIKGGIFELFKRIILSDIKSPLFREIKKDKQLISELNHWVFLQLEPKIGDSRIKTELNNYLSNPEYIDELSRDILEAAHIYSSYWEFQIIKKADPFQFNAAHIESELLKDIHSFQHLIGINKLLDNQNISNFINLCGQLRFQKRWGQTFRLPKTSVLGHSLFVACCSYFLIKSIDGCQKRIYNNFFGGLFHDLPEAVTRDIVSPVKRSVAGLPEAIKRIEREWSDNEIYPHVEKAWKDELLYFTRDEFESKIIVNNIIQKTTSGEINSKYNKGNFLPVDGEIIKLADDLAAFLEVWHSIKLGMKSDELVYAMVELKKKYEFIEIAGISINELYADF
jgi:putative hydrolases of HD superfamily